MVAFNTHTTQGSRQQVQSIISDQFWAFFSFACKVAITKFQASFDLVPSLCQEYAGKIVARFCTKETLPCVFYMLFNCDA